MRDPKTYKRESFVNLPQTKASAVEQGWEPTTGPADVHEEFSSLDLWWRKGDPAISLLFDGTNNTVGIQIAIDIERFINPIYDWKTQGFIYWSPADAGTCGQHFWTTRVYFCSPEYLSTSIADRIAARDPNKLVQGENIYVPGIDGKIRAISTKEEEIANKTISDFTPQACVPLMGKHYYGNMTENLECNAEQLFPFFPLFCKGQLVGIGIVMFGTLSAKDGCPNHFEPPPRSAVKFIVPRGPECLYDLADSPGLTTFHMYTINNPLGLLCPLCE